MRKPPPSCLSPPPSPALSARFGALDSARPQVCVWDLESLECVRRVSQPSSFREDVCAILPAGGCVWT
jgi:hypothetical protein